MLNCRFTLLIPLALLLSSTAAAQRPDGYFDFLHPYDDELLYVHPLINYAYDLQWQYEWERRQLSDNAIRVTNGSVAANRLLTDMSININQPLNDKWRFQGRFDRLGLRQRADSDEQLLLGLERFVFDASAIYLMINPQYEKEFMDIAFGYTFYKDSREQYVRVGVFFEDFTFDTKNDQGATSEQEQYALQWLVRLGLGNEWYLFSKGEVGNGFDRVFDNPAKSPIIAHHERRENSAQLRVSRFENNGRGWSAWVEWYDFKEAQQLRQSSFNYDYRNTQINVSVEHTRIVGERHRWRFLVHYIDQKARRLGYYAHEYDRTDILGGVFYEYLWPKSGATLAYAFGKPDVDYRVASTTLVSPGDVVDLDEYGDKIIAGWRYDFSQNAQIRIMFSHEITHRGFGGGSMQLQMFF